AVAKDSRSAATAKTARRADGECHLVLRGELVIVRQGDMARLPEEDPPDEIGLRNRGPAQREVGGAAQETGGLAFRPNRRGRPRACRPTSLLGGRFRDACRGRCRGAFRGA